MRLYEFLMLYKSLFVTMARNGISQDYTIYLELYKDYCLMLERGQKEAEIRIFLQKRYKLSASTLKRIIKELNKDVDL